MNIVGRIRSHFGLDDVTRQFITPEVGETARQKLTHAQEDLEHAKEHREEVREVATALARLRARNHFGESIQIAMMQKEKPV